MANLARFPKSPHCLFCLGRIANYDIPDFVLPFHRQLRGKKKLKGPGTLTVKLLKNIPGFGREGSVIPVEPGRMRNVFYPRQKAAYLSRADIKDLKEKEIPMERDFAFMMSIKPKKGTRADQSNISEPEEEVIQVQMDLLSPQEATEILSSSLPDTLSFYRTPITNSEAGLPSGHIVSPSLAEPAVVEAFFPAPAPVQAPVVAIYGSVSVADIAEKVKAELRVMEKGARVVLGPDDITIVQREGDQVREEADRLKVLGDFEVNIRVKGGEAVQRIVRISAGGNS